MNIELPDAVSQRMELVAEPRQEKGGSPGGPLSSWIELSEPQHIILRKDSAVDDKELHEFLAGNDGRYRYDYVRLGCTFCPQNAERFEKAWLSVLLTPEGDPPASPPISWSLFPLDEFEKVEETISTKIGSSAKILSAEIGGSSKITKKLHSLRGYREGGPNPYWELYGTSASSLDGILRFHMVVRSTAISPTLGAIRLEAVISNRSYVLFRDKRPFDQTPSARFRLAPG
jgi:hypothetical protein